MTTSKKTNGKAAPKATTTRKPASPPATTPKAKSALKPSPSVAATVGKALATVAPQAAPVPTVSELNARTQLVPDICIYPAKPKAEGQVELGPVQWLSIPRDRAAAALLCAGKGFERAHIQSVYLARVGDELRLLSTNSHVLLAQSLPLDDEGQACEWLSAGLLLPRDDFERACRVLPKGEAIRVGFGKNHAKVQLTTTSEEITLRATPRDCEPPKFGPVIESAGKALANTERTPCETTSLAPRYIALASKVAEIIGSPSLTMFHAEGRDPSAITFPQRPGVLFLVMPYNETQPAVSLEVARIIGPGMSRSIAALKAHATRIREKAKSAKDDEKKQLELRLTSLTERIGELSKAASGKALPAPQSEPVKPALPQWKQEAAKHGRSDLASEARS